MPEVVGVFLIRLPKYLLGRAVKGPLPIVLIKSKGFERQRLETVERLLVLYSFDWMQMFHAPEAPRWFRRRDARSRLNESAI